MKKAGICFLGAIFLTITPVMAQQSLADTVTAPAPQPGWLERETLSGDWGGGRTWLKEHGITLKPRLTQFYQGVEIFYNAAVTPWLTVGADLQVIKLSLASDTAVFPGLRAVIRF